MASLLNPIRPSEALATIGKVLNAKLCPMLTGSPALGKSSIAQQLADKANLKLIDIRLAQCDPTELNGFPALNGGRASYLPMDVFPIEGDKVPAGYRGWLLFLDELTSAPRAVQNAAYKLVLDRAVGTNNLHKSVYLMGAGNLATDNGVVHKMPTPLQSRLIHFQLELSVADWLEWAGEQGIDHRIISFILFNPDLLYKFDPNHNDNTYPSPRTWEFVSKLTKADTDLREVRKVINGTIGRGAANEYIGFADVYASLPTVAEILDSPETAKRPDDPSADYALTGCLSANTDENTMDSIIAYMKRMPIEFQVITVKRILQKDKSFKNITGMNRWLTENAQRLM